jgi:polar amino acid transport system permease protein
VIDNLTVITDNLGYLLLGRAAQGEPGGVLLSVLMTLGAAVLAFPAACCSPAARGVLRAGRASCSFCGQS